MWRQQQRRANDVPEDQQIVRVGEVPGGERIRPYTALHAHAVDCLAQRFWKLFNCFDRGKKWKLRSGWLMTNCSGSSMRRCYWCGSLCESSSAGDRYKRAWFSWSKNVTIVLLTMARRWPYFQSDWLVIQTWTERIARLHIRTVGCDAEWQQPVLFICVCLLSDGKLHRICVAVCVLVEA